MVRQQSEYVVRSLPGFWRIAKACMDGRYRKRDSSGTLRASHRPAASCRQMASDIVKLYIATLSQYFTLSDMTLVNSNAMGRDPNSKAAADTKVPSFVPAGTTVLAAGYFAERILDEVSECANELFAIDVGKEASQGARAMLESLRWRMLEVVASTWARDVRNLHLLEDWKPSVNGARGETRYLDLSTEFQTRVLVSARRVSAGPPVGPKDKEALPPLTATFKRKLRETVLETEELLFKGILALGTASNEDIKVARPSRARSNAPTDPEKRLLYTLATFDRLKETVIPEFARKVGEQLGSDAAAVDSASWEEMVEDLDMVVFDQFVTRRSDQLEHLVRDGVLTGGMDWINTPRPTEVRAYMHRVVLLLVEAHARVGDAAPALVSRALETLIERVCVTALEAFQRVGRFGTGGMLTATLEIEFFNQSVAAYLTPQGKESLQQVYNVVSQGYRKQQAPEAMDRDLDAMRRILDVSRRSTGVETLCFRSQAGQ